MSFPLGPLAPLGLLGPLGRRRDGQDGGEDWIPQDPEVFLRPLAQRLTAAADVMLPALPAPTGRNAEDAARLLTLLLERLDGDPDPAPAWLVLTALSGAFPSPNEVQAGIRAISATGPLRAFADFLQLGFVRGRDSGEPYLEMDVVADTVIVDVDFCATSNLHTGIQRVVRQTLPRWQRDHELLMVGWSAHDGAYRGLSDTEAHRVLRWGQPHEPQDVAPTRPDRLVVPWRCQLVLPENPEPQRCTQLAALARFSGSTVSVIGYDCIPVVSPELIHPGLPDRFVRYLSVLKHARTIAAISESATAEFSGFADMLLAQGVAGPQVVECALPVEVEQVAGPPPTTDIPMIMSVGSYEPRKNQIAVLHAAERLWREGLAFEVQFVGGGGYLTEFDAFRQHLIDAGRTVTMRTAITDAELWQAYRAARFTVFASLHEGYGLPVAESLALGTPALTTCFGSTSEIARDGGALEVDPRDDEALVAAMRRMLTDDELIARLVRDAAARPVRTWDHYAAELWELVVGSPGLPG